MKKTLLATLLSLSSFTALASADLTSLIQQDYQQHLAPLFKHFHQHPELSHMETQTAKRLAKELRAAGFEVTEGVGKTGVVAMLKNGPGPLVMMRADMDGLPVEEKSGLPYASKAKQIDWDGNEVHVMHACGHDTHTAMLVGAARLLSNHRDQIQGRVVFMFQPGEEGHAGARFMLDEGLLDVGPLSDGSSSEVTGAFAIHTTSSLPTGFISTRGGPIMASSDTLVIRVIGRGGHGSEPFRTLDPIPAACEIVGAMQSMITRRINVFNPGVLTVTQVHAGTAFNVIPEFAEVFGTIRAISEVTRRMIHDGVRRVAEGIAAAHGLEVTVELTDGYDVTVNSPTYASTAGNIVKEVIGNDRFIELPNPVMGAEDFGYVLNHVPGAMVFLGATPHDRNLATAAPNHSNRVFYDEDCMSTGISIYSAVALRHLSGV